MRNVRTWLVWSYEHNAWWRQNRRGYHAHIAQAGLYTQEEAREIEARANWYVPDRDPRETVVHEQAIPLVGEVELILTGHEATDRIHRQMLERALDQRDGLVRVIMRMAGGTVPRA